MKTNTKIEQVNGFSATKSWNSNKNTKTNTKTEQVKGFSATKFWNQNTNIKSKTKKLNE